MMSVWTPSLQMLKNEFMTLARNHAKFRAGFLHSHSGSFRRASLVTIYCSVDWSRLARVQAASNGHFIRKTEASGAYVGGWSWNLALSYSTQVIKSPQTSTFIC